ncbi:uncharacterized protein METZ01_LOCUS511002, partial [marine metagenome]
MRVTQPLYRNQQQIPDKTATVDGERTRTWAELLGRVSRL